MLRSRAIGLCVCGVLGACAQLGGFEDFREGGANGGKSTTEPGGAGGAGAATAAAGKTSMAGKAGATTAGSAAGAGSTTSEGGGGSAGEGEGGAPPQGGGGTQPIGGSGPGELLTDCVLLLHFEEASWSMQTDEVRDSSGFGNHGTAATNSLTTAAQGKFGRAAKFDGSGGVVVPDAPSLRPRVALTVMAWVNPTFIDENGSGIVTKRRGFASDTAFSLFLLRDAATASYLFGDVQGEDNRFTSVSTFVTNSWAHVALVFDGSAAPGARSKLYVNGELDKASGEASAQIEAYTSDVVIGDLVGGGNRFSGLIDEVAVWTRALSAGEIHDIFVSPGPL